MYCVVLFAMGWLRLVGCLKIQVSFAKELYKRDLYSAKRPVLLSILLIVATTYTLGCGGRAAVLAAQVDVSSEYALECGVWSMHCVELFIIHWGVQDARAAALPMAFPTMGWLR